jgi:4-amino-4-deoxy-L-arabinose transferase-like glycosyltransferase
VSVLAAFATVLLLALACAGGGRALLRILGLADKLEPRLVHPVAFVLGVGLLGWLTFFVALAGLLSFAFFIVLVVPGLLGLALRAPRRAGGFAVARRDVDAVVVTGLVLLAAIAALDIVQAMAPPADADTLGYHFALPKQFLAAGHLVFVPRAVDGAAPLLLHMTYLVALGIGGETALTLWVALLGWAAAWLFYEMAREFLDRRWALLLVILLVTTPAVVYGSGSGQLELKLSLFAMVAALAVARAVRTGDWRFACLAGLAVGFYIGAKYTGLIFAAVCGLVLLMQRRWLLHGAIYGIVALLVGAQWYLWNTINTGDPLFPILYDWLGAKHGYWSSEIAAFLRSQWIPEENPAPRTLLWLLAYPFAATLRAIENWDSGRTGLGPFGLLVLPFALLGVWRFRTRVAASPLRGYAFIVVAFYVLWFLSATSQRVRHLLPIYPFFLICITVAAQRFARERNVLAPLYGAVFLTLLVQCGVVAVFNFNYVRHLATGETREAFLVRNVARYAPVPWLNANLTPRDRVLLTERQLVYHLDVPSFTASERYEYVVDLVPGSSDPKRFLAEIGRLGITHILVAPSLADYAAGERHFGTTALVAYTSALVAAGCGTVVHSEVMNAPRSRTVPTLESNSVTSDVVAVDTTHCHL